MVKTNFNIPLILAVTMLMPLSAFAQTRPAIQSIKDRIAARTFPSILQAWNPADNLHEDPLTSVARHDLVFHGTRFFGLVWEGQYDGSATKFTDASIPHALKRRKELLARNPNMIMLAEIRYRDASNSYLPEDDKWWKRKDGKRVAGWEEGGFYQLDFANPDFRAQVARQAKAAMDSGALDGIMLDWWSDDDDRLALIKTIREAIGNEALILVNANDRTTPLTAPFVNGYYMECYKTKTADDWKQIADTLKWAEKNLKEPRINCCETWFHNSRQDLNLMRATTTLTLTLSDGYSLFCDPDPLPTPDHLHDWYDFWSKSLGKPTGAGVAKGDGSYWREFDKGAAVYNPAGNKPVEVKFDKPHKRVSTGEEGVTFTVPAEDGDIFLSL